MSNNTSFDAAKLVWERQEDAVLTDVPVRDLLKRLNERILADLWLRALLSSFTTLFFNFFCHRPCCHRCCFVLIHLFAKMKFRDTNSQKTNIIAYSSGDCITNVTRE